MAARSKEAIGRQARASGHAFERQIVNFFKAEFADLPWSELVRRSDQAHRAVLPDVTGVPGLWLELQKAARSTPLSKLEQAERDVSPYRASGKVAVAAAIARKKGSRGADSTRVTLRLSDLLLLYAYARSIPIETSDYFYDLMPVSVTLDDFAALYRAAKL